MKIRRYNCNYLSENCYVASAGSNAAIVDPGFFDEELPALYEYLEAEGLTPRAILLTHAHFDHMLAAKVLQERFGGIPVYMHPAEATTLELDKKYVDESGISGFQPEFVSTPVEDGEVLDLADGLSFKVIATPGHTPGGVCWYCEDAGVLFSGDTLFAGTIGRTDLEYGDYDAIIRSIMEKLVFLPGETDVYPGHGRPTTISEERISNPFLEPFNEPSEDSDEDLSPVTFHMD
ncbi:MAG: MBL fold metallo-hydrolase [Bacteroidales bacterium]|nr:MBL fold metallo-hydrolase [Bacteroidales bacterium]